MTTRTSKQAATVVTIDVDTEGTRLGEFDDHKNPIVSYQPRHDIWMLAYRTSTGTACAVLNDVHGTDTAAITNAVTAARNYLHDQQTTTASAPQGR